MAHKISPLDRVIHKLDRLDGRSNGRYSDLPLHHENTTGVCEAAQKAAKADKNLFVVTAIENPSGELMLVNCADLVQKLDLLATIAAKIPITRLLHVAPTKRRHYEPLSEADVAEMLIGYHVVDDMIRAMLRATRIVDQPLSVHFEQIDFNQHAKLVRKIGEKLGNATLENFSLQGVQRGYEIFLKLGERYKFDATPLRPASAPIQSPPPPPPAPRGYGPSENA